MIIQFGGHEFLLHPSGALYWPSEQMLIASDLHLEKGSHFALRGFFLPPYDSHQTLETLTKACIATGCTRLLLLGDCFHDPKGHARLGRKERALFDALLRFDPIWIRGNHDKDFVPEGFIGTDSHIVDGITFRHEATKDGTLEISGHYHPKTDIIHGRARITRPCFIEDGERLILPSFGAYTGGLSVADPAIRSLFKEKPRLYALGKDRVYWLADAA